MLNYRLLMQDLVLKTISDYNLIKPREKVILGLSSGPDSVCLLDILCKIKSLKSKVKSNELSAFAETTADRKVQNILDFDLVLAHVNYNLRGKDSFLDMILARKLAEQYNLPIYVKEVKDLDLKDKGLEAKCRKIRYDYFNEILAKEKADKIAVAHNKDDDAETILMFFLRGSGLKGLSGIKFEQNNIIRPLLNCYKRDILLYLKENHLEYRNDSTNSQNIYLRNKIRHELVPFLEEGYNKNLRSTICQSAKTLKDDFDYIERTAKLKLAELSLDENTLKLNEFLALDKSLQRAILRLKLEKFKDISFLDLEEALRVLRTAKTGSMRQIKGLQILKEYDKIKMLATSN